MVVVVVLMLISVLRRWLGHGPSPVFREQLRVRECDGDVVVGGALKRTLQRDDHAWVRMLTAVRAVGRRPTTPGVSYLPGAFCVLYVS